MGGLLCCSGDDAETSGRSDLASSLIVSSERDNAPLLKPRPTNAAPSIADAARGERVVECETSGESKLSSATATVAAELAAPPTVSTAVSTAAVAAAASAEDGTFTMGAAGAGDGDSRSEAEILSSLSPEEREVFLAEEAAKELHEKRKMKNLARTMKASGGGNPLKKKGSKRRKKKR